LGKAAASEDGSGNTVSGCGAASVTPGFNAVLNYDYPLEENVWQRVPVNESKYNDQLCFDAEANQFRAPSAGTYFFSANVFLNNTDAVEQSCQIRLTARLRGKKPPHCAYYPILKATHPQCSQPKASRLWKKVIPSRFRRNTRK
jgi:hypothetical protein